MKLYNTLTRQLEEFTPLGDVVKIYTCGPTVYNFQHIGNYASYVYWDLLVRALKNEGFKVKRVLNLTDVGHLSSDADEGEDKLEKGAKREGKTVWEIAEFYANDFLQNFRALNLTEPDVIARATDYIEEAMVAVDQMTAHGFTYETTDGIYYDTAKFADYAKFAKLDLENLKAGARVDFNSEKRNISDFAVWKFIKDGENHAMRWDYLGRPGYPGWHLECATIINKELGEPIDIHTGGIDHIPIHHTNEIAETFAISGKQLAKFWLHCNFITINGQKISKSLGNVYTLADLSGRGFSPMDFKLWVLEGSFQNERNFTFESLAAARARRLNWRNRIAELYQGLAYDSQNAIAQISQQLSNNLNSAAAFAIIDNATLSLDDWRQIDSLFGLNLLQDSPDYSAELQSVVAERTQARAAKDWATADQIRDTLAAQNITIKDTPDGPIWQYLA